ncbi:hypothetical protein AWJ14_12500 [Hoeflea olei]|uniref:Uncharacterized protein n=1 Tax=Hoeflea olei TaxID=1480615 RepID=A0A1C1YR93_9HYPH|nr:hypothetical protein AWJ14_12500 [Hoeflea olei]
MRSGTRAAASIAGGSGINGEDRMKVTKPGIFSAKADLSPDQMRQSGNDGWRRVALCLAPALGSAPASTASRGC